MHQYYQHKFPRKYWLLDSNATRLIPGSRIHSRSMHGYPYKSKDIQMDIHKIMDNWRLISMKHGYLCGYLLFTDIDCGMSLQGYPCLDINVDIHAWMYYWRLTSKNHGYPCWYPAIFGNRCMDLLWILGSGLFSTVLFHEMGNVPRGTELSS